MADRNGDAGGGGGGGDDRDAFLSRGLPTLEAPSSHNASGGNYYTSNDDYDESYPPMATIHVPSQHQHQAMVPPPHAQYGIPGAAGTVGLPMMGGGGGLTPAPPPPPPVMPLPGMVPSQVALHPDAYHHGGGGGPVGHYQQQEQQQQFGNNGFHYGASGQQQQQQQQQVRVPFGGGSTNANGSVRNRRGGRNERQRGQRGQQQRRRRGMSRDPRVWARYWKVKLQTTAADDYKPSKSEAWLAAISEAENKAQEGQGGGGRINGNRGRGQRPYRSNNDDDDKPPKLQAAGYLKHLRNLVETNTTLHDNLPNFNPPPPRWDADLIEEIERAVTSSRNGGALMVEQDQGMAAQGGALVGRGEGAGGGRNNENASRLNRYSAFDDDDEDDDSSNNDDGNDDDGELSDEEIVYHPTNSASTAVASPASSKPKRKRIKMALRRIVVRILASQADIHASIAIDYSRARPVARWLDGADAYETSFNVLTAGQLIIDTQFAKLLQEEEDIGVDVGTSRRGTKRIAALERKKADLADDSEIISVSLSSFVRNRDRYVNAANSRIEYLESRLYENQQKREEIRQAMGDRWAHNPNAKGDHAERRKKMEDELCQAQQGVERMGRMNLEQMVRTAGGRRNLVDV